MQLGLYVENGLLFYEVAFPEVLDEQLRDNVEVLFVVVEYVLDYIKYSVDILQGEIVLIYQINYL